ncbi:MAG: hypothetical protein ABIG39_02235 [Candidatus Micrarchaeota archaeon]
MHINAVWKNTCRILLREEIGDLEDYRDYLLRFVEGVVEQKSAISGKSTHVSSSDFCAGAEFVGGDEIAEYARMMEGSPLNINEVKDIDSVLEALSERLYYAGDITLGKGKEVEKSNRCVNSSSVYNSNGIYDSKYMAFCSMLRYGECNFGCSIGGGISFSIKCFDGDRTVRCFEVARTYISTDCYYVANFENCKNCMFSFNLRNKSRHIGNIPLSQNKYQQLSEKLIEEIKGELETKKEVPSIMEIIGG